MSETDLVRAILGALELELHCRFWRNNAGARKGGKLRYGLAVGAADIIGIMGPAGRFIAIEVKTDEGRLSEQQEHWGATVTKRGGVYVVVRSVAEALRAVAEARKKAA